MVLLVLLVFIIGFLLVWFLLVEERGGYLPESGGKAKTNNTKQRACVCLERGKQYSLTRKIVVGRTHDDALQQVFAKRKLGKQVVLNKTITKTEKAEVDNTLTAGVD